MLKYLVACFISLLFFYNLSAQQRVGSGIRHWKDLGVMKDEQRETRRIIEGSTPEFDYLEVHATAQQKAAAPYPAYIQEKREELILITEGTMKCYIGKDSFEIGSGSALLIPPMVNQQLVNIGNGPLSYYVFQFHSAGMNMARSDSAGGAIVLNFKDLNNEEKAGKGNRKYLDRPTAMTNNLEMHMTALSQKGVSHAGHRHTDAEVIIILEGDVSMDIEGSHFMGTKGDLFYVESGKFHTIMNDANKAARYFAIKWR
ncbi:MAG: cupin domain-containing protein [Ferruginibacter sp.]